MTRTPRAGRRRGFTLVEVAIASALLLALAVWAVPRLTSFSGEVASRHAQASVDQAVSASMTARRETGVFVGVDRLGQFDRELKLRPGTTDLRRPDGTPDPAHPAGTVSVHVPVEAPTALVGYAALDTDGWCWMLVRSFGVGSFDARYVYRSSGECSGQAALLQPTPPPAAPADLGTSWVRAYRPGSYTE